jgi:hypothetical protein
VVVAQPKVVVAQPQVLGLSFESKISPSLAPLLQSGSR